MKKLIFCFDGTFNNPEDVVNVYDDGSISNVLKLHVLLGGTLTQARQCMAVNEDQHSFYYSGVGNRGSWLKRLINAMFAPLNGEVKDILTEAHADFGENYCAGDEVYVFGFSRGAAIARIFASTLKVPIKFVGVFDTVAAIKGSADLNPKTYPSSAAIFENSILAPHVEKALHLLSLDERCLLFQPTLFNRDERVTEVWFPGGHSDVGGSHWFDGLSDVCLKFMLDNIRNELSLIPAEELDYSLLKIPNVCAEITFDDIVIKPLVNGKIHGQPFEHELTHAPRYIRVNHEEQASTDYPTIHISVAERFAEIVDYRPYSLRNVTYQVIDHNNQLSQPRYGIAGLMASV